MKKSGQGQLLVVDDNEMNRDMLSRRLKREGYTVQVAEDGYQALDLMYSIWDLIMFVHLDESSGPGRLELSVDYATLLFDRTTITELLKALRRSAIDLTNRLEDPVLEPSSTAIDLDDPSARLELVRSVWRDVLATDEINDSTGFFDAGGNSLLLVALVEQLSKATGRTFKTMEIFRAGCIAGQAALLAPAVESTAADTGAGSHG